MPAAFGSVPGRGKAGTGLFSRWFRSVRRHPAFVLVTLLAIASSSIALVDVTDFYFSSDNFCAKACHIMESTVYQELQQSKHWNSPSGIRPLCADCHVSGRLSFAMVDHFVGTGELFVWLTHDLSTPESFEPLRPAAAKRVRMGMLEDDSEKCRSCHLMEAIQPKKKRGQRMHANAIEEGTTCIVCHYNLVHKEVEASKEFLDAIEASEGRPPA